MAQGSRSLPPEQGFWAAWGNSEHIMWNGIQSMKILFLWCFAVVLSVCSHEDFACLSVPKFCPLGILSMCPTFLPLSLSLFLSLSSYPRPRSGCVFAISDCLPLLRSSCVALHFFCFVWSIRSSLSLLKLWAEKWNGNTLRVSRTRQLGWFYLVEWTENILVTGFFTCTVFIYSGLLIRSSKCYPSQLNVEALFNHRNFLQTLETYDELHGWDQVLKNLPKKLLGWNLLCWTFLKSATFSKKPVAADQFQQGVTDRSMWNMGWFSFLLYSWDVITALAVSAD